MLRKLCFLLITAILLTACGASAPNDAANGTGNETAACSGASLTEQDATDAQTVTLAETPEEAPESSELCNAEYFIFESRTNTVTNDDGLPLLYEQQAAPTFTSDDPERSEWVGSVLSSIDRYYREDSANLETYARDYVSMNGNEDFYSYSNYQQLGIARHDERIVSLIALSSLNSGGSHPNSVQTAYNLDIENRRVLCLEDLILEDRAGELAVLVRAGVDEKFLMIDGGNGLFSDYGATIDNSMVYGNMTPYWYLNNEGLVIFYNQYELGPYAAGIIKVVLPYEALDGILNPEYLPLEHESTGELLLRDDSEGFHKIPITIEREGETLMIGVEGTVYQVQLSEILWLENTPIARQLIFSARSLCGNDVLEITGGYTDSSRSFAIEYINGQGDAQILYIRDGELTEEP